MSDRRVLRLRTFLIVTLGVILFVILPLEWNSGIPIFERNLCMLEALEPRMLMSAGALGTEVSILDNGESGFGTTGSWQTVGSSGYDGDVLATGSSGGAATWTFSDLDPGYKYRVSVTWVGGAGRAGEALYKIVDHEQDGRTSEVTAIELNQKQTPSGLTDAGTVWEDLGGPHLIRGTSLSVTLSSAGSGTTVADAVRIERIGEWVAPTGVVTPEFGIEESHWMYAEAGKRFDYGSGPEAYRMGADGPYTHYVDVSASNATDSGNPFGTPGKPRKTIPTWVAAGSVVEIHGGSYNTATSNNKIILAGVGSASKPIFYRGAENDSMPRLNVLTTLGHFAEGRWIIVENLSMASGEVRGKNDHIAIRNNVFSNGGGLRVSGDTSGEWIYDLVIYNNTFHDNGDWQSGSENDVHGVTINMYNKDVWIVDNHGYHHGGDSVQVNSRGSWTTSNTYVSRNVFHHDRENAVDLKTLENVIVSENRMYGYRHTSTSEGAAFVVHYNPKWVWALNNEIYDSEYGMVNTGASDAYFLGNLIYDIHSHGYGNPSSAYEPGIAIHSRNSAPLNVANNTIYDVGSGIAAPNAVVHVTNNIIANRSESSGYDLNFPNTGISASSQMSNNVVYNPGALRIKWGATYTSLDAFKSGSGKGAGSTDANPQFVAPGADDFRLSSNSPALDAGKSVAGFMNLFQSRYGISINVDLDDNPRVYGSAVDIGAIETAGGTVEPNESPTVSGQSLVTDEDESVTGQVAGNDPDGDALTFGVVDAAAHGMVTMAGDGSFMYVPDADWYGTDSFTFTANDGWYDASAATVAIEVRPVNDAPVLADMQVTTLRQTPVSGQVAATDAEDDDVTFILGDNPNHGQLSFADDGTFTYTPDVGWAGTDSFTVTATDGTTSAPAVIVSVLVGSPVLDVSDGVLNFGTTGDDLDFTVTNTGEALLDYTITTSEPWLTVSATSGSGAGEADIIGVQVDRSDLTTGPHTATITVDAGVAGVQQLQVVLNVPTVTEQEWIEVGDTWSYRKGDTAPPADWNTQGFDDSSWSTGPSGIGYSSDISYPTTLTDMRYGYLTFYARKTFDVADPEAVTELQLGMIYDDGFVAYINGVEVARTDNLSGAWGVPVDYNEPTSSMRDELVPEEIFTLAVGPGLLHAGTNTLAIEVHNIVETSSDAALVPRLIAKVADGVEVPQLGDINADGVVDVRDIDLLSSVLRGETVELAADLTGDGIFDEADTEMMIHTVLGTEFGDANLDGRIDLADFFSLKAASEGSVPSWADGDVNSDGVVDLQDFYVMRNNFGFIATAPSVFIGPAELNDDGVVDLLNLTPQLDPLA